MKKRNRSGDAFPGEGSGGNLLGKARRYLEELCLQIPGRAVGSPGNRAATDLFAGHSDLSATSLRCRNSTAWNGSPANAACNATGKASRFTPGRFRRPVKPRPSFARPEPCRNCARWTPRARSSCSWAGWSKSSSCPRAFLSTTPTSTERSTACWKRSGALAVVAATGRNPDLAGSMYPSHLF